MKVYGIAEDCYVTDQYDDNVDNDIESVLCMPLGIWKDEKRANDKCKELNDVGGHENRYYIKTIELYE